MSDVPASCLAWDEDLSALIDEELPADREAELRPHLDACARCARRLEQLCNVDLALAGLDAPEAPSDLPARLAARIAAEAERPSLAALPAAPTARPRTAPPAPRTRWTAARLAALGAAAAALLLAVWVALRSDAPLQPEPPLARVAPAPEAAPEAPVLERSAPPLEAELPAPQIAQQAPAAPPAPSPAREIASPELAFDPEPPVEMAEVGLPELADLEEEDVALLVELEAVEDFDVIANLELLERFLDAEAAGGAG